MPTKECHTTKNTNTSQERNNFSVDMEEESSAIWISLNMYGDNINAVFASNHHAIHSKCYERYLNDAVLTALSAVYHILYPNINQFEQPDLQWYWNTPRTLFSKIKISTFCSGYGILVWFWWESQPAHYCIIHIWNCAVFLEACISYWCFGRTQHEIYWPLVC